jgi:hypothetical protein
MVGFITNLFAKKGVRDLNAKIPGAPNFTYGEFVKSYTATRFGIDNVPQLEKTWKNIENLAVNVIQPVRDEFGPIRITSGFRCAKLNKKINGSKNSNHVKGEAADIEPVEYGVKLVDIVKYIYSNLEFRNVIAEYFPEGWCHVDYREGKNLRRLKLKDTTHNYEIITINDLMTLYR